MGHSVGANKTEHPDDSIRGGEHDHGALASSLGLVVAAVLLAAGIVVSYLLVRSMVTDALLIASMVISGYGIAIAGIKSLLRRSITIDLLVTVAAIGATLIGSIEEGAAVVLLFNVAERLEDYAGERARHAIEALVKLRPQVALVRRDGEEVEVPVGDVKPGEEFVLRPGGRVPLDGQVIEGGAGVDQSAITGESVPVVKMVGDKVYAGTMNVDGYIVVRTTVGAEDTTLAHILHMVEEAEESRSTTEAFVDRFSRWYTPLIILSAFFVATLPPFVFGMVLTEWVYKAMVLLVVACPCALAISTPVAMVSAIANASRNGVLVKGSIHVEGISHAGVFAFDKTGTLTKGELEVSEVRGADPREVLRCASALEEKSEHPIGRAITEKAEAEKLDEAEPGEFTTYPGRGVTARLDHSTICVGNPRLMEELGISGYGEGLRPEDMGKTVILVSKDKSVIGAITLVDKIRPEAMEAVASLRARGLKVVMLTGDNEETARDVAKRVGVDDYRAGLLPEEKVKAVEELKGGGYVVVMVGDGINDAPALVTADVGVAMGAMGSDVALETADVALMEDRLDRVPYAVDLARATMRRIRENISLSVSVKLGVAVFALLGFVSLWAAVAVGDMGLSLTVILNALRLSRIRPGLETHGEAP